MKNKTKALAIFKSAVAYFGAICAGLFIGLLVVPGETATCIVGITLGLFLTACAGYAAIQEWQDLQLMKEWDDEEKSE